MISRQGAANMKNNAPFWSSAHQFRICEQGAVLSSFAAAISDIFAVAGFPIQKHSGIGPTKNNKRRCQRMSSTVQRFFRDESGLTSVEYAVAGALITIALVGAFTALGGSVGGTINTVDGALPG